MSKVTKQIECLKRLHEHTGGMDEMLQFLLEEKLIKQEAIKLVRAAPVPAKEMQILLASLVASEKFQLLEYEWTILPKERIVITVVTDVTKREFSYSTF